MKKWQIGAVVAGVIGLGLIVGLGGAQVALNLGKKTESNFSTVADPANVITKPAASTITNASLTVTPDVNVVAPAETKNLVTKDCLGIRFSYSADNLQLGYSNDLSSIADSLKKDAQKYVTDSQNLKCTFNEAKVADANYTAQNNIQIFPLNHSLKCFNCGFLPQYISIYDSPKNLGIDKFLSNTKNITNSNGTTIQTSDYLNTSEGIQVPRKAKYAEVLTQQTPFSFIISLDNENLKSFNKTEEQAVKDFQEILDTVKVI
jgi:hypothetical protein